jgi:hypothetical protein
VIGEVRDAGISRPELALAMPLAEALVLALRGDPAAARSLLAKVLEQLRRAQDTIATRRRERLGIQGGRFLDPVSIGNLLTESVPIHVRVGDYDQALEALGLVAEFFAPNLEFLRRDPLLDPLRVHPILGPRLAARLDELRENARELGASRVDAP